MKDNERMNREIYCNILKYDLKPSIYIKRRGMLSKGILLQHDNVGPHVSIKSKDRLKFETLEHPTYSLSLDPSDFWLFGHLKKKI